jgi:hypothetical protein
MVQGVEFDEEQSRYSRPQQNQGGGGFTTQQYSPTGNEPKMVQWLLRHGYAKSPTSANVILLVVVALNIIIVYFVITNFM